VRTWVCLVAVTALRGRRDPPKTGLEGGRTRKSKDNSTYVGQNTQVSRASAPNSVGSFALGSMREERPLLGRGISVLRLQQEFQDLTEPPEFLAKERTRKF
jgi:hypothetical protein